MNKKKLLILYSLIIPLIMIGLFTFFSNTFDKTIGYFVPYGIYLIILLIGILVFNNNDNIQNECKNKLLYYILSFVPVVATFYVAFLPTLPYIKPFFLLVLLIYALLNGFLEEMFWRRSYNKIFGNNIVFAYILPTIIFTCWHFALLFAKGVSYGNILVLIGGAGVMGIIWGLTMFKTKNIKMVILAHILVNFFAFSQLLYENWFI